MVGLIAAGGEIAGGLAPLYRLVALLHPGRPCLGRIRQVKAVDAAEDAVSLPQRSRTRLNDAGLAQVVSHPLESFCRGGDASDQQRQRSHEVAQPWKERAALQEVVMAFDQ